MYLNSYRYNDMYRLYIYIAYFGFNISAFTFFNFLPEAPFLPPPPGLRHVPSQADRHALGAGGAKHAQLPGTRGRGAGGLQHQPGRLGAWELSRRIC